MRDMMSWSIPLPRLFGIPFRMHLLFPIISIGLILRAALDKTQPQGIWLEALCIQLLLLVSVVLHELGHCFGARWVEGDANEVLIWPLGGLAFVDVPHTPRANFIATAAGPAVTLIIALVSGIILGCFSLVPTFNPFTDPYTPDVYNGREGAWATSPMLVRDAVRYRQDPDPAKVEYLHRVDIKKVSTKASDGQVRDFELNKGFPHYIPISVDEARTLKQAGKETVCVPMPWWQLRVAQLFALNWFLFVLNLLPAFPLDGGRMLQAIVWARSDFRYATSVAVTGGYVVAVLFFVLSLAYTEPMLIGLAMFIAYMSFREQAVLQQGMEESQLGYDFSQGYTSLERDQPPPPKQKRPNFIQRWLQRRRAARLQKETERRESEERRLDELLDKVHRLGKDSLTAEEKRFMERVSARYRNRS